MKKISVFMVIAAIGMIVASCGNGINTNAKLSTEVDSVYYAIGAMWGSSMKGQLQTLPVDEGKENYNAFLAALATAFDNEDKLKIKPEEGQMIVQKYVEEAQTRMLETSKAESETFLASNRSKAGVITTESGLQYKVITEGTGPKPTLENTIIAHYTLTLLDGTMQESTVERGEPLEIVVSNLIEGWKEVLQLMPVGSKYQVWIPSELAYDMYGPQHPLYSKLLVFEMELLGIKE